MQIFGWCYCPEIEMPAVYLPEEKIEPIGTLKPPVTEKLSIIKSGDDRPEGNAEILKSL
jgi:hypothetical protein